MAVKVLPIDWDKWRKILEEHDKYRIVRVKP